MIGNLLLASIKSTQLFRVNIFMPVTKFPCLTILLFAKGGPSRSLISSGNFSLTAKIEYFALRKKGREKTPIVKVLKSCHQVMGTKKCEQKDRATVNF